METKKPLFEVGAVVRDGCGGAGTSQIRHHISYHRPAGFGEAGGTNRELSPIGETWKKRFNPAKYKTKIWWGGGHYF